PTRSASRPCRPLTSGPSAPPSASSSPAPHSCSGPTPATSNPERCRSWSRRVGTNATAREGQGQLRGRAGVWLRKARPARFPGQVAKTPREARRQEQTLSNRTFVIGVGMTKFEKPGSKEGDYPDWAKEAGEKALADAGIPYEDVQQAYAGYCYGDSTYGQRALYQLGLTGIPVVNVNNNCSTGSSALF